MLDITYVRENQEKVALAIKNKKSAADLPKLIGLDDKRRLLLKETEDLRAQKNTAAASRNIEEGKLIKEKLASLESQLNSITTEYTSELKKLPSVPSDDTPIGPDESANVVLRKVGEPTKFDFKPLEHWELGKKLGVIETDKAGIVSGSRFAYLMGDLVLLQTAILSLTLKVLASEEALRVIAQKAGLDVSTKPFKPVLPPVFIKPEVMDRMGRLEPRDERYHTEADDLYLVGSAEHTLGPLHMDETLKEGDLPIRYVGYSTAFRREAGSYGKDMKGVLRLHQFDKIEIESFAVAEDGEKEQAFIVAIQEYLLQLLKIPYQVIAICTGDMGAPDVRQIDMECWMPGQNRYRETHTSDYMGTFQAMRLKTKVKRGSGVSEYVHMNDATVFAMGRIIIAIMENYQTRDGNVVVPEVLRSYVGKDLISTVTA